MGAAIFTERGFLNIFSLLPEVISMLSFSAIDMMINSKGFIGVNLKQIADHRPQILEKCLNELMQLFEHGVLKPEVSLQFNWNEIGKAHSMMEHRKTTGKVVLTVSEK